MASKFKHNFAGYVQVMNYSGVQNMCKQKAQAVKEQADHMLSTGGYTAIDDHERHEITMSDGRGAQLVVTHSLHAMRSQNKKKTLTKALGAGA